MTIIKTETTDTAARSKAPRKKKKMRLRFPLPRRWKRYAFFGIAVPMVLLSFVMAYYWVVFSRMIDARMSGEMARTDPRVFARPFELHRGQALTERQLIDRLNDLGYAHRTRAEQPGEFTVGRDALVLIPRDGDHKGRTLRLVFGGRPTKTAEPARIDTIEMPPEKKPVERVTLDSPLITALVTSTEREKRRDVPLQSIPKQMIEAVLAIEDRRFYDHPGIDPIGIGGAIFRNVFGTKAYLASGSTLTQQLVKNTFLTPEKTPKRKMIEWFMSVVLETRLTKDQILQLYLNDVSLGQRGSFAIHGVAEAARLFFAKDIANVSRRRGGHHRRRHPIAVAPFSLQQSGAGQRPSQRGDSRDGRHRLHQRRQRRSRRARTAADRRRAHSKRKPPTSSTTSARSCRRSIQRPGPLTSTRRWTSISSASPRTRCAKDSPGSTRCWRAASGSRRRH